MAEVNWKELKARLGRDLLPREWQFVKTGGLARSADFDFKNRKRPEVATEENCFDARLIRWLLAGEIAGVTCRHEGVELWGLWVEGWLDLAAMKCDRALQLIDCTLEYAPLLLDTRINGLCLNGSALPGLNAHRLDCRGSVHLARGCRAMEKVNLVGAKITGQLACSGGSFKAEEGPALDCERAVVGDSVFLDDGFEAEGEVNLAGAQITGQLACRSASFKASAGLALNCEAATIRADVFLMDGFNAQGDIGFIRAEITGDLACGSSEINGALVCDSAQIGGTFFWHDMSGTISSVNFTEAHIGVLSDDAASWRVVASLDLSGLCYDSIQSDMTVVERLTLLARKYERPITPALSSRPKTHDFDPQPYSQLAKVYEAMGHRRHAALVRYEREKRLAQAARRRMFAEFAPSPKGVALLALGNLRDFWTQVYRVTFGFGHRPFLALLWIIAIIGGTAVFSQATYTAGQMAPASPVVLTSAEWLAAAAQGCPATQAEGCTMPLRLWEDSVAYRDYETFSPFLYALDLFLPLDTLGQEQAWSPSKDRGWMGETLYYARWLIQLSGWLLIATAAAVLSGVLGKKD